MMPAMLSTLKTFLLGLWNLTPLKTAICEQPAHVLCGFVSKHYSIRISSQVVVNALLLQGATALHIACQTGNADVMKVLVERGAPLSFDANSACKVTLMCLCPSSIIW